MNKVVFLLEQVLDERNYSRFGIQTWLDRGWQLEVWDLTPWAHPAVWQDYAASGKRLKQFADYFPIDSARALARRLEGCGSVTHFVDLTGESYHSLRAKWPLLRRGVIRVVCALGSIPVPPRPRESGFARRLMRLIASGPVAIWRRVCNAFFVRVVGACLPADWVIVGGEATSRAGCRGATVIRAHNFDYDIFMRLEKLDSIATESYAVFIDQDYCFHPEYIYKAMQPLASPQRYFPAVCAGLGAIASALGVAVRIAAHPRTTYRERGLDCFPGFPIAYGATAELIKDCRVVVCHDSTAIQFAVLFEKPAIFVTTNELVPTHEGRCIAMAAAELGKTPINLDETDLAAVDWTAELRVDTRKYAEYRARYIKSPGSQEDPVWKIVIDQLERAELDSTGDQ
ncbi:MAG: hypothetical protein JSR66_14745 [Proteobacteria bacterium]|nr:hypothetical protein [Pseudomonadota bacterium]